MKPIYSAVQVALLFCISLFAMPALAKDALLPNKDVEATAGAASSSGGAPAPMTQQSKLVLGSAAAEAVAHQIWLNETGGNVNDIVAWNAGEEFVSLGIGHFIWFPAGSTVTFDESFRRLIEFYKQQKAPLPDWLARIPFPPCPWQTRAEFLKAKDSPQAVALRKFMFETKGVQAQFLVERTQAVLGVMLAQTPDEKQRKQIEFQFYRVASASVELYPLIDYLNFKGEGISPGETTYDPVTKTNQGWGLRYLLLAMTGTSKDQDTVLSEFADAAKFVLLRRIRNHPQSRIWQEGWIKRVETYRRPLLTAIPVPAYAPAPKSVSGQP